MAKPKKPRHDKPKDSKRRRAMTREEAIEFITRQVWFGWPEPLEAKAKGRKPTRTQYDAARDRRRGLYHKLARLPKLRVGAGDTLKKQINSILEGLILTTPPRKLASATMKYLLDNSRLLQCDIRTVRRIIKENAYRKLGKLRYLPK